MRLTLRTLLAYLDDLLPPTEARDMGRKIADSPVASQMRDRIKDVVRRRRVEAPAVDADPDPNRVAEYLDNLLSADDTAEHERDCLASDPALAETAACHQVLTLVLGQPIAVDEEVRQKMVALSPEASGKDSTMMPVSRAATPTASEPTPAEEPKSGTRWGRLVGIGAALAAAAGLFGAVLLSDDAFNEGPVLGNPEFQVGRGDAPVAAPLDGALDGEAVRADDTPEAVALGPDANVAAADEPTAEELKSEEPNTEAPAVVEIEVPDEPTEVAMAPEAAGANEPAAEEMTTDEPTGEEPAAEQPTPEPTPPAVDPFAWQYASDAGVVLSPTEEAGGWAVMPREERLSVGRELVVPQPFQAVLRVSGGPTADAAAEVTLSGGVKAVLLGPSEKLGGGIHLDRGRIAVRNTGETPVTILVDTGRPYEMTLGEGAVALADVRPGVPQAIEDQATDADATVLLVAGDASAKPTSGNGPTFTRTADGPPIGGPVFGAGDNTADVAAWGGQTDTSTLTRRYAAMFAKLLPSGIAVDRELPAVLDEPLYRMSELAAEALSLFGDGPAMVSGLNSVHKETRRACVRGLREWLAEDPSRRDVLTSQLAQRYRPEVARRLAATILGYTRDDLRRPSVSRALIDDMSNDEIALREAAFLIVNRYADRDYSYMPDASSQSRTIAVNRWRDYLDDEESIVQPTVEETVEESRPLD